MRIQSILGLVAAFLITISLGFSNAQAKEGEKGYDGFKGKASAVSETSITVSNKKDGDKTFKLDDKTKVIGAEGEALTVKDLKADMKVMVKPGATPDAAAESVKIAPKPKKKDK
ncbi:hypothetical protein DB346_07550 [Verrucomicrobia bacterium LW23]|nr:hypothetical protein DB346_07550 [Verrucomicrobia bacterium LW23]